jgi:hypothetical protein
MNRAALLSLLLAAAPPLASPRILPLITAAVRASPQSAAPPPATVRRMLGSDVFTAPKRHADADAEWLRFDATDNSCSVELGPIVDGRVLKLVASCRFAARDAAIQYLHQMVGATEQNWQPPVFWPLDGEMAHIGIIMKRVPVTAEAYLQREENGWRAALVIAAGGRSVTPVSTPSAKAPLRSHRTSF